MKKWIRRKNAMERRRDLCPDCAFSVFPSVGRSRSTGMASWVQI